MFLGVLCCLGTVRVNAQTPTDDTFTVSDLTYNATLNAYYFTVSLDGSRIYTAYNLDIILPDGVTVLPSGSSYQVSMVKGSDPVYPYTETYDPVEDTTTKTYTHTIAPSMPETNVLRIACKSDLNAEFRKMSGELFRVFVTLNSSLSSSFSPKPIVKFTTLNLTTKDNVKYVPADFSCRPFSTGIPTERTLSVNVSSTNKVGTLIVPFDAELPSGLQAYTCAATEGDQLTLTPAASLEACKPYIVYAPGGYSGNITGTVGLSATYPDDDVYTEGLLTGVLTNKIVNEGYILQNQGSGPLFYDADGVNFSLPAGRCYFKPISSSVKAFGFDFDHANSLGQIHSTLQKNQETDEAIYDLSGRRVSNPTHGIYIIGTRKVMVKQ